MPCGFRKYAACAEQSTVSAFLAQGIRFGIFLLVLAVLLLSPPVAGSGKNETQDIHCAIQTGPCSQEFSGGKLTLDITPKPVRAMQDLTFTVTLLGKHPAAGPYIDLTMPGMAMGRNRVMLKEVREGIYQGTGIIVRCPSGRRTWKATVVFPLGGSAEFVFDVIY
jgi:hypothetical protein